MVSFLHVSPTKALHAFHVYNTTRSSHLPRSDLPNIWWGPQNRESPHVQFCLQSSDVPPSWAQNIFITTPPVSFHIIVNSLLTNQRSSRQHTDARTDRQCRQKRNVNTTLEAFYYSTQYCIVSGYPIPRADCFQTFQGRTRHVPGNRRRQYPD